MNNPYFIRTLLLFGLTVGISLHSCGPTATKSLTTSTYDEDLSIYREKVSIPTFDDSAENKNSSGTMAQKEIIEPTHGISAELDSVTNLITAARQDVRSIDGFTIQLYSGNDRNRANQIRKAAFELLEDSKPKISYDQPNYKVRVGQYYTRLEANRDYTILKEKISRAVLIPTLIPIQSE